MTMCKKQILARAIKIQKENQTLLSSVSRQSNCTLNLINLLIHFLEWILICAVLLLEPEKLHYKQFLPSFTENPDCKKKREVSIRSGVKAYIIYIYLPCLYSKENSSC